MRDKGAGLAAKNYLGCDPALLIYINYTENSMANSEKNRKLVAKYTNWD